MISSVTHKKLVAELAELRVAEIDATRSLEETKSDGDFRENEPYQIAKSKFIEITQRIHELQLLLEEEVQDVMGNSITLGRLLKIVSLGVLDDNGQLTEPEHEEMILLFDTSGDTVVDGILAEDCELGRLIKDGREGLYTVNAGNFSRLYQVSLYTEDTDEYFRRYPVSKKTKIEHLLRGEIY